MMVVEVVACVSGGVTMLDQVHVSDQGEPIILLAQCSWCGRMLNGPLVGQCMVTQTPEGKTIPDLSQAETHGICDGCCGKWKREVRRCLQH
jgi:hypothetical protein